MQLRIRKDLHNDITKEKFNNIKRKRDDEEFANKKQKTNNVCRKRKRDEEENTNTNTNKKQKKNEQVEEIKVKKQKKNEQVDEIKVKKQKKNEQVDEIKVKKQKKNEIKVKKEADKKVKFVIKNSKNSRIDKKKTIQIEPLTIVQQKTAPPQTIVKKKTGPSTIVPKPSQKKRTYKNIHYGNISNNSTKMDDIMEYATERFKGYLETVDFNTKELLNTQADINEFLHFSKYRYDDDLCLGIILKIETGLNLLTGFMNFDETKDKIKE